MRKEVLTTTQAYLSTLFNLQATEDQVRHIQEILGEAWVGRLDQDGWYLQHIEELQTIASLLNLPAQTTWESEQRQAQEELEHTVNSVMKQIRPIAGITRIDVLVAWDDYSLSLFGV